MKQKLKKTKPEVLEPVPPGRPAVKSHEVLKALRRSIISGEWSPGERLPTRRKLCATLDCSAATLQQAMNTLGEEGFLISTARSGTVLSHDSPHLTDIGIVFSQAPETNRFWTALGNEASKPRDDGLNLRCWYGIDEHPENPSRKRLERDVRNGRLAGVFFACNPYLYANSPLLMHPGIPRVAFGTATLEEQYQHKLSVVTVEGRSFSERATAFLREQGRHRLAVIAPPGLEDGPDAWREVAARHGFDLPSWAYQEVDQGHALTARYLARLLFREAMPDRPDGLIVADDNLVEQVTLGIADAGVNVPQNLDIVAHCNFPWPPPSALPVTRLGFDAHRILEEGLRLLRESISGAPSATARVDAVFERELNSEHDPR